ncbi:MAG: hypothetical protein AAF799_38230 [Myxococcota bacterium]
MQWGRSALAFAMMAGSVSACDEPDDPWAPERLAEIARARGDAQGHERTGVYQGEYFAIDCPCEELDPALDLSLCTALDQLGTLGLPGTVQIELIEADGQVRLATPDLVLEGVVNEGLVPIYWGPIDTEGQLQGAGMLEVNSLLARGRVQGLAEGQVFEDQLQLEIRQRYALQTEVSLGADEPLTVERFECEEHISFDLQWDRLPTPTDDDGEPDGGGTGDGD